MSQHLSLETISRDLDRGADLFTTASELADHLIDTINPVTSPDDGYRRLLEQALATAASAQRKITAQMREIDRLKRLSLTDEATGVLNRRGFNISLDQALARVRRSGESGVLMLIDLDKFKHINDRYGHQAGDLVLASIATVLSRRTRMTDAVARIGGDEFAVVLCDSNAELGIQKAEELERAINMIEVPWDGDMIPVGASVGIVSYGPDDTPEELVKRADKKMYSAKGPTAR
jgi:diguanylate cyclase (GGDEF)-like protein